MASQGDRDVLGRLSLKENRVALNPDLTFQCSGCRPKCMACDEQPDGVLDAMLLLCLQFPGWCLPCVMLSTYNKGVSCDE